ncbi:MAG: copper resistance protein CopC [Pseudomonadota bacterium]
MRLVLIVLLAVLFPHQAFAHAQLRDTVPTEGAVVATAPEEIVLTFNEPISPLALRLIAPDGTATDVEGTAENTALSVRIPKALEDGTHLLSWRIVSADGHPVGGTLTFHVGAASVARPPVAIPSGGAARASAVIRFVLTAALVVAVGTAVFAALVERGPPRPSVSRIGRLAAILCLPAGVALLGAQGLDLLALPADALFTIAPWQAVLAMPLAVTVLLSVGAAALSFGALGAGSPHATRAAALTAWGLAGLSYVVSGHASVAPPRWLTAPAITSHALALIFWLGALIPLLSGLHSPGADTVLRRFSTLAVPLVALLVASGAALTWAQTGGDVSALAGSAYGMLLGAKLILVVGLLALAVRNRLMLTPALAAGVPGTAPRLARAIRIEIFVGLMILLLASGFRLTPPPRALDMPAEPVHAHIHTDRAKADITLTPGRAGPVDVELAFRTGDFTELIPREVEVIFAMPDYGIEPIRADALRDEDGLWRAGPVSLPTPGEWQVSLRLLINDFESVTLRSTITLE